jgi:hypothetical protein
MIKRHKRSVAAGAVALFTIAGGGAAVAATQSSSPTAQSDAIIADAAGQLGVTSTKLSDALKQALENQVDAAAKAGTITQAQATEMKSRIEAGQVPLVGLGPGGGGHGFGHHGGRPGAGLDAAATYLGVTRSQLMTQLQSGKSLADVAKANDKSVDGLVAAMVADAKQHIAADVKAGRLTEAQQTQILSDLQQHVTDMVNGTMPQRPDFNGPPPAAAQQPSSLGTAA